MLAKNSEIHRLPQSQTWQQLDIKALWPHSTHHNSASRYTQCMLSFCCSCCRHKPDRKSWNKANWKRSFKFMILILTWCNLQFFHNGRFETILFARCPCMWFLLNVFWLVQDVLLSEQHWQNIYAMEMVLLHQSYFQRKCFFILNLIAESWSKRRKSDGTLCRQDSGAGLSLWCLRSASWEQCSALVKHILDWRHILMGTRTLPSFSALLVRFFLLPALPSSETIAWRFLGKTSLTHRTLRPWAHAGVTKSHYLTKAMKTANHRGMALGITTQIKHWHMQTCN